MMKKKKLDFYDNTIEKIDLRLLIKSDKIYKEINNIQNYKKIKMYFKKNIKKFTFISQANKLSRII